MMIEPEEVRARMLEEAEELLVKYDLMLPSERTCVDMPSPHCRSHLETTLQQPPPQRHSFAI
jgi:hypothetical protein